jgi:murein DD-endopeptidase MepM/ murein hydrolase activator NlpD
LARPSSTAFPALAACVLALAVVACQQPPELRGRSVLDTRPEPPARPLWVYAPVVAPDLDEAQALAWATRTVLQSLPPEEQRRILEAWLPSTRVPVTAPEAGVELASAPAPLPRREVELLSVLRELHARHGTRVLTLSAFFLGSEPVERARKRLRLAPERIGVSALYRVLRRRERPVLSHVSEAERWTTLYALGWPVERTWRISSRFGPRIHPVVGGMSQHRGIDIALPVGTEVRAPASGVVTKVLQGPINGNWLELDHGNGVRTQYCHLSLAEVKRGQQVKAGERVALSGDTGRVTGPHLHYQVKVSQQFVDPLGTRATVELVAAPWVLAPEPLATLPQAPSR